MPIATIGAAVEVNSSAASGSTSITVPGDCTYIAIGVAGWFSLASYFSGGILTLNSVGLSVIADADDTNTLPMSTMWGLANPDTGSQTLAWDWSGASAPSEGVILLVRYLKGVDPTTPIRDSGFEQVDNPGLPASTGVMTAQSGDYVLAVGGYFSDDGGTSAWSGVTEILDSGQFNFDTAAMAEATPSGNVTVDFGSNPWGASVVAVVFIPETVEAGQPLERWLLDSGELTGFFVDTYGLPVRQLGGDATATPATVAVAAGIPAAAKAASVEKTAATVNVVAQVLTPVTIGGTTATPASVNAFAAIPPATVTASSTKTATTVNAVATVPAVTKTATAEKTVTPVNVVSAVPPVTVTAAVTKLATTVNAVAAVPAVIKTATAEKNATPVTVAAAIPASTRTASVEKVQATVNAVAFVPQAAASGSGEATVISTPVTALITVPAVLVTATADKQAVTVNVITAVPTPGLTASVELVAVTITVVAGIPFVTAAGVIVPWWTKTPVATDPNPTAATKDPVATDPNPIAAAKDPVGFEKVPASSQW